jgi:hypothetical protein
VDGQRDKRLLDQDSAKLFGLTEEVKYTDGTSDNFLVSFSEDSNIWQYACGAIVANKAFNSVIIRPPLFRGSQRGMV